MSYARLVNRLSVVAIGILVAGTTAFTRPPARMVNVGGGANATAKLTTCSVTCFTILCDFHVTHKATVSSPLLEWLDHGEHSACTDGTCGWDAPYTPWYHLECNESFDVSTVDYSVLSQLIRNRDVRAIAELVVNSGGVLTLNAKRSSIQVSSCSSRVRANLPLTNADFDVVNGLVADQVGPTR